jgi:uncharacterized protein YbaR (Trm112 family)
VLEHLAGSHGVRITAARRSDGSGGAVCRIAAHPMEGVMGVSKELIDILICPNCHGNIEYDEQGQKIRCTGKCGYVYPVRDDIPIMLIDEAEKPANA